MKLKLVPINASQDRAAFLHFWFRGKIELRKFSHEEILEHASRPNELIRQYGLARVISLYRENLLPALRRLPKTKENWRARFEVCCQLFQMLSQCKPPSHAIEVAQEILSCLVYARFTDDPKADADVRRQVRAFIVPLLIRLAGQMRGEGNTNDALRAYEMLDQLQSLDRQQRSDYAALLWSARDRRPSSLRVYMRHLSDCNWEITASSHLKEMSQFVEGQLNIDEDVNDRETQKRLVLNQVVRCQPSAPVFCLRNIGVAYLRLKEVKRALPYLRRAHSADGNNCGATTFHLGQAFFRTRDFNNAAQAFDQAAARGVSKSRIASWQGLTFAQEGNYDDALDTFRSAESALEGSLDAEFYVYWGRASFLMGSVEDAAQRFRAALRDSQKDWRAAYGLAICLERVGQRREAINTLREATGMNGWAPPLYLLSRLLQAENLLQEAIACARRAVALNPDDIEYCLALASALDYQTDLEAPKYLEKAARARVGGPEIVRRLAVGMLENPNCKQTPNWIVALADACPSSASVARYHARELARQATLSFNSGDFNRAIELWTRVAEANAENSRASDRLALALVCQAKAQLINGNFDGAREKLERAGRLSLSVETRLLHGVSNFVQGDFHIAKQSFSTLARSQPDSLGLSSLRDIASLLSIGDARLSQCILETGDGKDSTNYLLGGIRSGLLKFVSVHLQHLSPAKLEDDLPWPSPPDPFELEFEPLEKTIQRER